jgi:hypothetical protein
MNNGFWKTRSAGRIKNNERMIEGNMGEDKWSFRNGKKILRCNATKLKRENRIEHTHLE